MDIHCARITSIVIAPDLLQELLSGEGLPAVFNQESEQGKLLVVQSEVFI